MSEFIAIPALDESKVVDGNLTSFDGVEGQTPFGYRGYKIRKTVYKKRGQIAAVEQAGFFKHDDSAMGWHLVQDNATPTPNTGAATSVPVTGAQTTTYAINTDQANASYDTQVSTGQNALKGGDRILASILTVSDDRAADDRTGMLSGTVLGGSSAQCSTTSAFGISLEVVTSRMHSLRQTEMITRPCASVERLSVVQYSGKNNLPTFNDLPSGVTGHSEGLKAYGPVSVVSAKGLGANTTNIEFQLTIYSLSAIRPEDGAGSPNIERFDLDELLAIKPGFSVYSR